MAAGGFNGVAVGAVAVGAAFVYGGVTGRSPMAAFQASVRGLPVTAIAPTAPITAPTPVAGPSGAGTAGTAQSGSIAARAQGYVGAGYVFGGAPAAGVGHWDCSSFANWVIGHDTGLAIPGYAAGTYTGKSHGPRTVEWLAWSGAVTVGHHGADAMPGDLCCWQTHMGIAIGGGQMVSARSEKSHPPTGINTIDGDIKGEFLFIRRLKSAGGAQ